jgi:purine-binding chemotaxis protein CheW
VSQGTVWERLKKALNSQDQGVRPAVEDRRALEAVWRRRAEEVAKPTKGLDGAAGEETPVLVVRVGEESYGLPLVFLREIQKITFITRVPGVPPFILGVINLRGEVVSVIDPAVLLEVTGGSGAAGKESRIVVAEVGGIVVGLRVEKVVRIAMVPPESIRPRIAAAGSAQTPLSGVVTHLGEVYPLVDLERMLGAEKIVVQHEA